MSSALQWVFDPLPASGARRGGNPAEHAFRPDLGTFVREVVQNANDQAIAKPRIQLRFVAVRGDVRKRFLNALAWPTLRRHLSAAAQTEGGHPVAAFLDELQARDELLLAYVEDYGTVGLTGDESEGESHFRALCKDTLFSHKREAGAGGSYGLGKSVLWIFSGLSTVLFQSTLIELAAGKENPRLIGRAELPSHDAAPHAYAGSGWFGRRVRATGGARAESVWGDAAADRARALGFAERGESDIGTSILVVGFRDPTDETEPDAETYASNTRRSIAEYFWPAMHMPRRQLRAAVRGPTSAGPVLVDPAELGPFLEAWRPPGGVRERLEQPGDVIARALPFTVPPRRDGGSAVRGEVELKIRLASDRRVLPREGQVALFRGPGMVVRYWDRSRIGLGMRPFHATLACGSARSPKAPTDADDAIEQFLRLSEPPSHDDWIPTQRLKETYKAGYRKTLDGLRRAVDEALREALVLSPERGERGPDALQRRFPIGKKGALDKRASAFSIARMVAHPDGDAWVFSARIAPAIRGRPWRVRVALAEVDERDVVLERVPVTSLSAKDADGIELVLDDGVAELSVPAEHPSLELQGRSGPGAHLGALQIELRGQVEPAP